MKDARRFHIDKKVLLGRVVAAFLAVSGAIGVCALTGCENTGIKPYKASEEEIIAANDIVLRNRLTVGCWIPPRPHQMTNDEEASMRMKQVRESGINMVCTHHSDLADMDFVHRLIRASAENGVDVMIELDTDLSEEGIKRNLDVVRDTMDCPGVIGYNLYDEPVDGIRTQLAEEYRLVKEMVPGKLVMMNLLPAYGPLDIMAPDARDGLTQYQTYIENFADTGTDVLSFDNYPYWAGAEEAGFGNMLLNCSDFVLEARKYDRPIWGFIQDCSWAGMNYPDLSGIRLLTHVHLLFQVRGYSYFLYAAHEPPTASGFTGMLRWDGKKTATYNNVKQVNGEIEAFGNRVLSYDLDSIDVKTLSKDHQSCVDPSLRMKNDGRLKSVASETGAEVLVGLFTPRSSDANAKDGYAADTAPGAVYVVNFNHVKRNKVTVKFRGVQEYTVWGPEGIEDMGAASELVFDLDEGDARFIEFKNYTS